MQVGPWSQAGSLSGDTGGTVVPGWKPKRRCRWDRGPIESIQASYFFWPVRKEMK
uniref:Uncharacterized protein n=2 Tax=Klebsiella pneumoniae TaxID=573 RepID=A0A6G9HU87_KLEPN|nr:hypothetical protein PNDLPPAH_00236 [Klebsiella pneumoniae subsp. pneumoniae]QGW59778.1 hypothetical protein DEJEEEBI_00230 [Klebsiella pneumoniae]QUW42282.1 hypothetical protein [Escherichia coli]QIK04334.1 hypothetical protein [Klebsiella pneumoniae]QIQ14601.1 hypothetical protein [Klebsiella pneumoniae]